MLFILHPAYASPLHLPPSSLGCGNFFCFILFIFSISWVWSCFILFYDISFTILSIFITLCFFLVNWFYYLVVALVLSFFGGGGGGGLFDIC
ncbi:hypothetical protein DFP73DRAFT_552918 [Morchella snyderi]|nr:hypothetical protein DFP73DRAFT_552918 [Morchella snyderi]